MKRQGTQNIVTASRRAWTFSGILLLAAGLLVLTHSGRAQQQSADGRARRAGTTATPTPTPNTPSKAPSLTAPPPAPTPFVGASPTPNPDGVDIDPGETIRVDTNLVNLSVRVIDRNNRPVNDVGMDDFRVYEDNVLQKIEFVSTEEVPISYGLAIDTSGSLRSQIGKVIEAGKAIINSNKPGDETFLVRFISSDKIETVQDFTSDKVTLVDVLDSFYPEGGQTAVIDAVYLSAEHVANYKKGDEASDRRRRALIVVTDGEDRFSYYNERQLFERLREEDVQIFVIGFVNELESEGGIIRKSPREKAIKLLNGLAEQTGGRVFFPKSIDELPGIAAEITRDMRTQYVVSYSPTNDKRDGTYRTIRVSIADASSRDRRIAIAKPGRTAPRDTGTAGPPKPQTTPGNNKTPSTTGSRPTTQVNQSGQPKTTP